MIPTLELIGVGGLLPRMIFHRLEPMFEYPEKWDFPIYIYMYLYFSGFFVFFDVFCPILDFIVFLSIFGFYGSCRMWHQSGDLFLDFKNVKKPEKVEKSRKNDVFWGPKKRVKVGPFCTTPIFGQKSCFLAS